MPKKLKFNDSMKSYKTFQVLQDLQDTKKDVLFIIGDQNAKVGRPEIPGATGKFDLGVQNEVGQRLTVFSIEHWL